MYRQMWEKATDEILEQLVAVSPGGLTFIGQKRNRNRLVGKMEHLSCYFPGNIALGVAEGAVSGAKAQHYLEVAANLTYTCWQMYERTTTGRRCLAQIAAKGESNWHKSSAPAPGASLQAVCPCNSLQGPQW